MIDKRSKNEADEDIPTLKINSKFGRSIKKEKINTVITNTAIE